MHQSHGYLIMDHCPTLSINVNFWGLTVPLFLLFYIAGKEFSRGGAHGKTACMVPTARSLRVAISLTTCSSRTRSGHTTTSLPFYFTRQPVVMVASGFLAGRGSPSRLTHLPVISPYWLVIGSSSTTLYVYILKYPASHLTAHFSAPLTLQLRTPAGFERHFGQW